MGKEGSANEERLFEEIKVFSLASHLFWSLWSIVNVRHSQIPFGYMVNLFHFLSYQFNFFIKSYLNCSFFLFYKGLCRIETEKLSVSQGKNGNIRIGTMWH